ncbi:MAG TPA: hypothetical protein PKY97_04810, partial [Saprospiraceae bacterium]|nr:hypothetical protein [Saprospiraceae bacterium]
CEEGKELGVDDLEAMLQINKDKEMMRVTVKNAQKYRGLFLLWSSNAMLILFQTCGSTLD